LLLLSTVAPLALLAIAFGQQGRREIVSDDFTKPRPTPTPKTFGITGGLMSPKKKTTPIVPPKHYRFSESSTPNAPPLSGESIEQLGITLWRLRPATAEPVAKDDSARLLIREGDKSSEWIPERIEIDTPLRTGDRVRLSIESPRAGYLYIVDRELFADGSIGQATLLFPSRDLLGGNNQVNSGKLIDLPGQYGDPNNFLIQARRNHQGSEQSGELLTIIVTTSPLGLEIGDRPLPIPAGEIAKWEKDWSSLNERFELVGGAGKPWTKAEKEASSPNGPRPLTRYESPPQTIYRIAATNKTAFLINVRLSYAR
jgi:hypothetical protein